METESINAFQDCELNALDESKTLHGYIVNGDIENVKTFLISKTHSQSYINEKRRSAAFVAIEHKKFEIYSLLISHEIRFVDDYERRILKELTRQEQSQLNEVLVKNFIEINNAAVHFLLSHTRLVGNKNSDKINDIERYYKELNDIPEIGLVFSVIKCSGFVDIIFDFEMDSIVDIDSTASSSTKGACYPEKGRLLIGAKRDDENLLKGTIAHELTHYAMQIVYLNDCQPYHINDKHEFVKFDDIIVAIEKLLHDYQSYNTIDKIIRLVFECYYEPKWPQELIVRVNHMLAFHGKEMGEKLLIEQAEMLLKFYRENVMPSCKHFIEDNYLFKPKSEFEIFNLSSGLVTRIENSAIKYEYLPRTEMDSFISDMNESFLLISSSSPILSTIKLYQTLNKLDLNLNQYLLIDDRSYLKQPKVVIKLLLNDCCRLIAFKITEIDLTNFSQFLQNILQVLETKPKFKIILVIDKHQLADVQTRLNDHNCTYKIIADDNIDFPNLTPKSQNEILLKEVEYQSEQITLTKLINETNVYVVDEDLLSNLASGDNINIGKCIEKIISKELQRTSTKVQRETARIVNDVKKINTKFRKSFRF